MRAVGKLWLLQWCRAAVLSSPFANKCKSWPKYVEPASQSLNKCLSCCCRCCFACTNVVSSPPTQGSSSCRKFDCRLVGPSAQRTTLFAFRISNAEHLDDSRNNQSISTNIVSPFQGYVVLCRAAFVTILTGLITIRGRVMGNGS